MIATQTLFQFVKDAAIIINGLFVALALLLGLLWMLADVGTATAVYGLVWGILMAGASIAVVLVLIASPEQQPPISLAYLAVVFSTVAATWAWYNHFNLSSKMTPPAESVVCGSLGILNLTA